MDLYRITFAPKVRKQIDEIAKFVKRTSEHGAELLGEKFEEAIGSLDIFPTKHPVRERRRDQSKTTYGMVVHSYIIYYRVDESKKMVHITEIRHGARRQPRRFS